MRMGSHVFFNGMAVGETNTDKHRGRQDPRHQVPRPGRQERGRHAQRPVRAQRLPPRGRRAGPAGAGHFPQGRAWPTRRTRARSALPSRAWSPSSASSPATRSRPTRCVAIIEAMKMETSVVALMDGKHRRGVHRAGPQRQGGRAADDRCVMKLYFSGHDCRYAAEQSAAHALPRREAGVPRRASPTGRALRAQRSGAGTKYTVCTCPAACAAARAFAPRLGSKNSRIERASSTPARL